MFVRTVHAKHRLKALKRLWHSFPNNSVFFLLALTLLIFQTGKAQIITTGLNETKAFVVNFNPAFIKAKNIKSITKHITNKPDNHVIVDKGLIEYYEFNKAGLLVSTYTTEIKSSTSTEVMSYTLGQHGRRIPYYKTEYSYLYDTTFVFYTYDSLNRMTIKRTSIIGREVFKSHYFEYDPFGNFKKETVIREVNSAENIRDFKPGMQTVLSVESFTYETLIPGQIRKKFLNDEGRVYKEGIIHSDEKGRVTEESFDFSVTWIKERNNYQYNDKGLLSEKKMTSNDGFLSQESYEYGFDATGLLQDLQIFKSGVKINNISFVYSKENNQIESEVNRDDKNASIGIVKYEYGFY